MYSVNFNADPGCPCLITAPSIFMDSIFCTVSFKVSPFLTLLVEAEKLILSAPNLFSANEKLILVLVEFSKNMFTTVLPLRRIAFLLSV